MQSLAPLLKASLGIQAAKAALPAIGLGCSAVLQRLFASEASKRLYVGNLSFQTKAEQLAEHFGKLGQVSDVVIPLDHMGRSRGYAFVEMDSEGAATAVDTLNQSTFMGRTIWVNEARPKEDRPPRDNRSRGEWSPRGRQQRQQDEQW